MNAGAAIPREFAEGERALPTWLASESLKIDGRGFCHTCDVCPEPETLSKCIKMP